MPFPGTSVGLFRRQWRVTIDTLSFTKLDIEFKIEKSLKDTPNKCELTVYNLSEDSRKNIEKLIPETKAGSSLLKKKALIAARKQATKGIPVKIEAGYAGTSDSDQSGMSLLWLGDLRTADSRRVGPDWVTKLESGDGEKAYQNARVNVSYGAKTPVATALRAIAKSLNIGEGNLAQVISKTEVKYVGKILPHGIVLSGPAAGHLSDFCRSAELEWSIQDGTLQILDIGAALKQTAVKLSAATGMIESPTVDVDGILSIKTLLIPDIRPGRLLVVDSAHIKGNYRAEKVTYSGNTASDEWGIEIHASLYGEAA